MADEATDVEETGEGAEESKGRGLLGTVLIALVAVGAGAAGGAAVAWKTVGAQAEAAAAAAAAESESEETAAGSDATAFQDRLFSVEPVVMNISGDGYTRFLKVKVELACDSPATVEELAARLPQIKDTIITLMSSKRVSDVSDFEGKALLKHDLQERLNQILSSGSVESVLFTEFVIQ